MIQEKVNASDITDAVITKKSEPLVSPLPGMLPTGTKVKLKKTDIIGEVNGYHLSADGKVFSYLIGYSYEGINHEKSLLHNQIEEIK